MRLINAEKLIEDIRTYKTFPVEWAVDIIDREPVIKTTGEGDRLIDAEYLTNDIEKIKLLPSFAVKELIDKQATVEE